VKATNDMPDTRRTHEKCQATAKNGKPCAAKPRPGRPYCLWHDPEAEDRRREISRQGGYASSNRARAKKALPADPLTNEELHSWLGVVFKGVIAGRIEPGVGTAGATIARTMAELTRSVELEQRIANLEEEREPRRTA